VQEIEADIIQRSSLKKSNKSYKMGVYFMFSLGTLWTHKWKLHQTNATNSIIHLSSFLIQTSHSDK